MEYRKPLNPRQTLFVAEYLRSGNAHQSAVAAGFHEDHAKDLMANETIQAHIARARDNAAERAEVSAEAVLRHYWGLAKADPRSLFQKRVAPCRYCWGIGGAYQWKTQREFDDAYIAARESKQPKPTSKGGFGYNLHNGVNLDCPECSGVGVEFTTFADTSTLTADELVLFAGMKTNAKGGLEIMVHDQSKAVDALARHFGLFTDKIDVNISGDFATRLEQARARIARDKPDSET